MDKKLLKKLRGEAKSLQDLDRIFVELKKGLIEMMYGFGEMSVDKRA